MALVGHLVQAGTSAAREAIEDPAAVDVLIERETASLLEARHGNGSKSWVSLTRSKGSRGLSTMQFQLEAVLEDFRWKAHLSQTLPSVARDNRDNVKMCQDRQFLAHANSALSAKMQRLCQCH